MWIWAVPSNQKIYILDVIVNLRECDSGKTGTCYATMIVHGQTQHRCFCFLFFEELFQGPFAGMVLLLASFFFFSILVLPYWFHRLINVKHQKLVSLIMVGKGFKNSGICASEQRLYQQVPVTASWKKKTELIKNQYTWFPKGHLPCTYTVNS